MFKKITFTLFIFTILIFNLISFSTEAREPKSTENNSDLNSICGGSQGSCPTIKNYIDKNSSLISVNENFNPDDCNESFPINKTSKLNDLCYLQNDSRFFPKPSTLTFAISAFRLVIYIITAMSILVIISGLIATIIMSILRKKFAVTPFIVFAIGILFLVVSIICTTIISLTSFL
jgi:hypothetical protein